MSHRSFPLRPANAVCTVGRGGTAASIAIASTVVRLWALGSMIADLLVRAGVGTLHIVDRDFVELSNLQRQSLFDESRRAKWYAEGRRRGGKTAKSQFQLWPSSR